MTGEPLLELANVHKAFGGLHAVTDVSLELAPGERLIIIGPNGAGKTTLFNLISGDLKPTSGQVRFAQHDTSRWPPYRRAAAGLARTYQITSLFRGLTVAENVLIAAQALQPLKYRPFGAAWSGGVVQDRVDEVLTRVELWDLRDEVVSVISYGDQRRLEVALALVSEPRLLLFDEPMAGLSPAERPVVGDLIRHLPEDIAFIVVEHDIDMAFQLGRRVVVMHEGKVLAEGTPDDIRANPTVQDVYLGGA